nr:MAG TPA: hypothetical protein [Caudoviricetes sp.]
MGDICSFLYGVNFIWIFFFINFISYIKKMA